MRHIATKAMPYRRGRLKNKTTNGQARNHRLKCRPHRHLSRINASMQKLFFYG